MVRLWALEEEEGNAVPHHSRKECAHVISSPPLRNPGIYYQNRRVAHNSDEYLAHLHVKKIASFRHLILAKNHTAENDGHIFSIHLVLVASCHHSGKVLKDSLQSRLVYRW